MVIGNGMLAKLFYTYKDNNDIIIFASGVSNSKEDSRSNFNRELDLIKSVMADNPDKIFVYFSTVSMYDPCSKDSSYVKHKIFIEDYIKLHAKNFYIFRISQIIGRAANKTLINFFINAICSDKNIEVWKNSTRNLIFLDDVFKIIDYIIKNNMYLNQIINIANPQNIKVTDLINILEAVLEKKGSYTFLEQGSTLDKIDISLIELIFGEIGINFDQDYYIKSIKNII